ncbi:MAG: DUF2157 domain-containing protein [Chlorobi bacterium]|nr:DUF2157 domain-containing protein [Chlorobiota bacterium]
MSIRKETKELLEAEIITEETAEKIKEYYKNKTSSASSDTLFSVFAVLGALSAGLGIILLIARNWDDIPRKIQTILAFIPLLIGQFTAGYILLKKQNSIAAKESSAVFLFLSAGANLSLISLIYNISESTADFLFTWLLLVLPVIYIMKSSASAILYIFLITYYAVATGYGHRSENTFNFYWIFIASILPFYYRLIKKEPESNYIVFFNWIIPVSLIISLGIWADNFDLIMFPAYMSFFGLLSATGNTPYFSDKKNLHNSYKIIGAAGLAVILLITSFGFFENELRKIPGDSANFLYSPEFAVSILITAAALTVNILFSANKKLSGINILNISYLIFFIMFFAGMYFPGFRISVNILILIIGILLIKQGSEQNSIGILNFGLIIISALIICRFFDTDLSFIIKGILFISAGAGFFSANYMMLKKRKQND